MKYRLLLIIFLLNASLTKAQWQQLDGPWAGGTVYCLEEFNGKVFAGTNAGIYTSNTSFIFWSRSVNSAPNYSVRDIENTNSGMVAATHGDGIYVSVDSGATWNSSNSGLTSSNFNCLTSDDSLLFAGSNDGKVFKSTDGGVTWNETTNGLNAITISTIDMTGSCIFAGTSTGVFVSTDFGNTWNVANTGLSSLVVYTIIAEPGFVFLTGSSAVYTSTDSGATWVNKGNSPNNRGSARHMGNLYYTTNQTTVKKSVDNGNTWTTSTAIPGAFLYCIAIVNSTLIVGDGSKGSFISQNDGLSWVPFHDGMKGFVHAVTAFDNYIFVGTLGSGIYRSTTSGTWWDQVNNGMTGTSIHALEHLGNKIFAGTDIGLFVSNDFGATWDTAMSGNTSPVYAITVSNNKVYVGSDNNPSLSVSADSGLTWTTYNQDSPCTDIAVSGNKILTGNSGGPGVPFGYYTDNNGTSWTSIPGTSVAMSINAAAISATSLFFGNLWILNSDFTAANWNIVLSSTPGNGGFSSDLLSLPGIIYSCGTSGVFYSMDDGASWINFSAGLDFLYGLNIVSNGTDLFLATQNGVWTQPLVTAIKELNASQPAIHIYPNPGKGTFMLSFTEGKHDGDLVIYNQLGAEIYHKTIDASFDGLVHLPWLADGLYLCSFTNHQSCFFSKLIIEN